MAKDGVREIKELYLGLIPCVMYPGDKLDFNFSDPDQIQIIVEALVERLDLQLDVFVKVPSSETVGGTKTIPQKLGARITYFIPCYKPNEISCTFRIYSVEVAEGDLHWISKNPKKADCTFTSAVEKLINKSVIDKPNTPKSHIGEEEDLMAMFFGDEENGLILDDTITSKRDKGESYYANFIEKYSDGDDITRYIDFVDHLDASEEIKEAICTEIKHVSKEPKGSQERATTLNWLDTVCSLPWDEPYSKEFSLSEAKDIIEKSHYGMEDVKKRILEFLAVRKKTNQTKGAIICLVGPPGVGKSSIAKSVAEALGKKFSRFSVGSLHDESDIVGYRRTYIASRPGKLVQCLKSVHSMDPVILIDEIDKAPTPQTHGALLEVLDPEQNKEFQDVYLDFPLDLSNVVFVVTANDLSTIPAPLYDRMEIIEVSGYTENEKLHIANDYLIPKQFEKNGIKTGEIVFGDNVVESIITGYTMEAGVRSLERSISKVIRKKVNDIMFDEINTSNVITKDILFDYLGVPYTDYEDIIKADKPGTSLGLSVSNVGFGSVMRVEIKKIPGKGDLILTGKLGDVIKESATLAFTWLKGYTMDDDKANDFFTKNDFHLHIPEGATAKDGSSAGIAFATAFYSLFTNQTTQPNLAMTGEINLSGEVTAIGGLKEKILGAKRNKVTDILIPKGNIPDLKRIAKEITDGVNIHTISTIEEGIKLAFQTPITEKRPKKEVRNGR